MLVEGFRRTLIRPQNDKGKKIGRLKGLEPKRDTSRRLGRKKHGENCLHE